VYCAPWEREKLEKLARYIARPNITEERLRLFPSGEIGYKLKRDYSDGTSALIFSPLEFMEKAAALVPQPRIHLTRFHGVLAPHAKIRSLIVPTALLKEEAAQPTAEATARPVDKPGSRRYGWTELLSRVFAIDMKTCPSCGGEFKIVSAILETQAIVRILNHLGLPSKPPEVAPARLSAALEYCQA
jgi:hypothetical protein